MIPRNLCRGRSYRVSAVVTLCFLLIVTIASYVFYPENLHAIFKRSSWIIPNHAPSQDMAPLFDSWRVFVPEELRKNFGLSWIIPNHAPSQDMAPLFDSWRVFVPEELRKNFGNCDTCYNENTIKLVNLLTQVTGAEFSKNESIEETEARIKMARLLFLLHHEATGILHTSDISSVNKSVERFVHDDQPYGVSGMEYVGKDLTLDSSHYLFYSGTNHKRPCQYRLQYKMKPLWTVGVRCRVITDAEHAQVFVDFRSPPVFASNVSFTIDSFSDSFFSYEGFWAMFATLFSGSKQSRVWSLWTQRMLQEVEGQMAITPLACPSNRTPNQMGIEPDTTSQKAFQFVTKWKCEKKMSFFACSTRLASDLLQSGYVKSEDVTLHNLWLSGLKKIGYAEPARISKTKQNRDNTNRPCVIHIPALITPQPDTPKKEKLFPNIRKKCQNVSRPSNAIDPFVDYVISKPPKTADIALVIIICCPYLYNFNMPLLYDMHHSYFSNIIFCGSDLKFFRSFQENFRKPVTFIQHNHKAGTPAVLAQVCVTQAMALNYDVIAYLQMSDDNLLNVWNIGDLPRDKFWFQKDVLSINGRTKRIPRIDKPWLPWLQWTAREGLYGMKAIPNVWMTMGLINNEINIKAKELVNTFRGILRNNSGGWDNIYYQASDVFYIPSRMRQEWLFFGDIFNNNNVLLEIAVPTLIYGMDTFINVFKLTGHYLWEPNRHRYLNYYKYTDHFLHPWKLSNLKQKENANFFCFGVLGEIVRERTRVP